MASGGDDDSEVMEGFLCPMCKADLKSATQLTEHFESRHQEEQDVLKSLKDILGKAKKKILNFDEADLKESIDKTLRFTKPEPYFSEEVQEIGVTRSSTEYFKVVRSSRLERYATETNKLLIRLNKLMSNMPTEPSKRKQHEQDVVPWLDGASVKLCPNCAKAFNIARRKHHCRLCGSILCNDCSFFLNLDVARRMVDPLYGEFCADCERPALRLCEHCFGLMALRQQVQERRNAKTVAVTAYEQMRSLQEQAVPLVAMYEKMCQSMFDGEATYNLSDVNSVRGRIGKLAEGIDLLSKQIAALPTESGSKESRLYSSVRQAATQYMKDKMLSLRKLPTEAQIAEVRRERRARAERSVEDERRRAAGEAAPERVAAAPRAAPECRDDDSPLLEQMNIIRDYIKQARRDGRCEEVGILELNLKELKKEYQLQMISSRNFILPRSSK